MSALTELLAVLDLERIEDNIFRGYGPRMHRQRVFGGLVISQALVAASRTVEGRAPHSLHAYFILPGDPSAPIVYDVDRIRDGRSFTTRRCVAIQHGRPIFSMSASFQVDEEGFEHAVAMPDVPDPDSLPDEEELRTRFADLIPEAVRRYLDHQRPIALKPVDLTRYLPAAPDSDPVRPRQHVWIRADGPLPDDPSVHRAMLAYLSDMTLIDTALVVHRKSVFDHDLQVASLDHALWFHRPFRADEWMLYAQDSPNTGGGRGLARGSIFTRDGRLIASVAQEGLLRQRNRHLSPGT
jgi:acyl-CoA thioesterase-2